ncbi:AEC family transporter [Xanthobacter sp. TB0139]|uniref:AEC family transporter n=1 Tax=Xanthobacter sp. TB0139 TaxID=3459178 RepID=UPI0040396A99
MLETIVAALLPIVVTLMFGFFAGWRRNFDQEQVSALNRMVMLYALPMLLFSGILQTPLPEITRNTRLVMWITIGMVGSLVVVFGVCRLALRTSAQLAALRALAIGGPAVPFVGTPVLSVLYPVDADLAIATGSMLLYLVQLPLVMIFLAGGQTRQDSASAGMAGIVRASLLHAVRQPVVWAPLLAFGLLLLGFRMPHLLEGSFTLLGHATSGVALFAVGVALYDQNVSLSWPVIINVFCRNLLIPVLLLGLMGLCGVPDAERALAMMTLALPTAAIVVIFALEAKCAAQEMASTLFVSTVLSVVTMGFCIWLAPG